jgi:O-acetyl-ADP-ribose deacetylase (regulator of RNase III)
MRFMKGRVETLCGDITEIDCNAIVNAANSSLMGGGGVDGAIHRAAGPSLLKICRRVRKEQYPEGLPPGEAVLTGSGNLPFQGIIHTVGPIWQGGNAGEAERLSSCYRQSLMLAEKNRFKTIAFPAISTGVYAYPPEKAALVVYNTLLKELLPLEYPKKVYLVFYSHTGEKQFLQALENKGVAE